MRLVVILWFSMFSFGYSQGAMIVNDPMANASLAETIANGAMQLENGIEQLEFLKKAADVLEKVNESLSALEDIENIYEQQKSLHNNARLYLRSLQNTNLLSANEMKALTRASIGIINKATTSIQFINKVLNEGIFKMNDADRIRFIKEQNEEVKQANLDMYALYASAKAKAEKRAMLMMFKSE